MDLAGSARALAKNPLGVVALFLVLVYGFASLLLGTGTSALTEQQRWPFVWFLTGFPVLVLAAFFYLVIRHHEKLYAPSEFRDERHFFRKLDSDAQRERLEEEVNAVTEAGATDSGDKVESFRPLSRGEIRLNISLAEDLALRALEQELRTTISREVAVNAGDGWLNLDGAVARGERLLAIEVKYFRGGNFPVFQIEHLLRLMGSLKFERFSKTSVLLAVVSDAPEEEDTALEERLRKVFAESPVQVQLRMFRLNALKAKYGV